MAVTLINTFIVREGQQEESLRNWQMSSDHSSKTPGFIETKLHRNTGVGNGTFAIINIAKWTSAEAWRSTHEAYKPTESKLDGVKGHPAIFEPIVSMAYQGYQPQLPGAD